MSDTETKTETAPVVNIEEEEDVLIKLYGLFFNSFLFALVYQQSFLIPVSTCCSLFFASLT